MIHPGDKQDHTVFTGGQGHTKHLFGQEPTQYTQGKG